MATNTYYATVSAEGASGPIRGKLPTGLVRDLKAESGAMIQFEVTGRNITGGRVLTAKEQNRVLNERGAEAAERMRPKATAKPKAKAKAPASAPKKSVAKANSKPAVKTKTKQAVPAAKPSNRKTKVKYEEPTEIRKPKKKISFGKKK